MAEGTHRVSMRQQRVAPTGPPAFAHAGSWPVPARRRRRMIPVTPNAMANNPSVAGSGVSIVGGPICTVYVSASAPLPHDQTYVPGTRVRSANVTPDHVAVSDNAAPDV